MPRVRWLVSLGAVSVMGFGAAVSLGPAQAQVFGHHPAHAGGAAQQVNCDAVAANPGSGMDKATCEAMLQAQQSYDNARNDPAASRPGDAAMTCADIKAEFMQQPIAPPSQQHVAAAKAASTDYMAKQKELQAQAMAHAASLSAAAMAASATDMVNPIAGRAADQAVDSAQRSMEAADNAQARAELIPRARTTNSDTAAVMGDMTSQLQNNPRTARLVALADEKRCKGW